MVSILHAVLTWVALEMTNLDISNTDVPSTVLG